jgi:hypothetical protein
MSKREVRFFNTTGPCNLDNHYIEDELYWVLHAPRQTGKTTFLKSWMREINGAASDAGEAAPIACYVSIEDCQGVIDVDDSMQTIYHRMSR